MSDEHGIGFITHVPPMGSVPSMTKVDVRSSVVPFFSVMRESRAKSIGVCWKHASVSSDARGHRRYCQPPPWFARTLIVVSTVAPASHTAPVA